MILIRVKIYISEVLPVLMLDDILQAARSMLMVREPNVSNEVLLD